MVAITDYNVKNVTPMGEFRVIPAGDYLAAITKSEWRETLAKDGKYLQFTFQVLDGKEKGETVRSQLNLKNKSEESVKFALQVLAAIKRSVNLIGASDTEELHNIPLRITIELEKYKERFKNVIRAYHKIDQNASPMPVKDDTNPFDTQPPSPNHTDADAPPPPTKDDSDPFG